MQRFSSADSHLSNAETYYSWEGIFVIVNGAQIHEINGDLIGINSINVQKYIHI